MISMISFIIILLVFTLMINSIINNFLISLVLSIILTSIYTYIKYKKDFDKKYYIIVYIVLSIISLITMGLFGFIIPAILVINTLIINSNKNNEKYKKEKQKEYEEKKDKEIKAKTLNNKQSGTYDRCVFLKINDKHFKKIEYVFDDETVVKFYNKNENYLLEDYGLERCNTTAEMINSIYNNMDKWEEYLDSFPADKMLVVSSDEKMLYLVKLTDEFELEAYSQDYYDFIRLFNNKCESYKDLLGNEVVYWTADDK